MPILSAPGFYPAGIAATGVIVALIFNINSTLAKSEVDDNATQEELAQVAHWESLLLSIAIAVAVSASAFAILVAILSPSSSAGPAILICALSALSCVLCAGIRTRQQHPLERARSASFDSDYLRRTSNRHRLIFANARIKTPSSRWRLVTPIIASSVAAAVTCTFAALMAARSLNQEINLWSYISIAFLIAVLATSLSMGIKLSRWTNLQLNPERRDRIGRVFWYIAASAALLGASVFARPADLAWALVLVLLPGFVGTGVLGYAARKSKEPRTQNSMLIKIGAPLWSNIGETLRRRYHAREATT